MWTKTGSSSASVLTECLWPTLFKDVDVYDEFRGPPNGKVHADELFKIQLEAAADLQASLFHPAT